MVRDVGVPPPICVRCGDHVPRFDTNVLCARCQREPPVIVRARSAGVYDGALRDMIHCWDIFSLRGATIPGTPQT